MEDSFRVRLDRAFGSLPLATATATATASSSSLSSLWSLTHDEINTTNRTDQPEPEPYPVSKPYTWSGASAASSSLENDLEELDDEEDDGDARVQGRPSKPDDYDDEQWEIRSGIGRDCTLDYEEEEDKYDKQAIGKESSGDRLYMKDVADDGVEVNSSNVLPTTFREHVRDPRANRLAAKLRLKQDDEAAKNMDALHVSDKSRGGGVCGGGGGGGGDVVTPKSILKSRDNASEHKSQKRVRFDSECDDRGNEDDDHDGTRDVRMKTSSMEEEAGGSDQSEKLREFASAVPDYIRNPSRYTKYTLDSDSNIDEKANKEAYMSFLAQIKGSSAAATADDPLDDLPSVTFIARKKSGDAAIGESEKVSPKQKPDRRSFTVSIAADDENENSEVCAMEEDEPEESFEDVKKSSQRFNRRYRKKPQEEVEESTV